MAYRFHVNQTTCINCGICMDLCPVRCLDMSRPAGEGEIGSEGERHSPVPGDWGQRAWMMLVPVKLVTTPAVVIRPMELLPGLVNHRAPSGPVVMS